MNFYLSEDDGGLLERMETLRHRDRWTMTRLLKEACTEYVNKHLPGNPALPLTHWTEDEPLSQAAREKLEWGQECQDCVGTGKNKSGNRCHSCAGLGRVGFVA